MNAGELETCLRTGPHLALDTNVMFGFRELGKLDILVRAANRARTGDPPIRLVIPALVHAEMLHDLRCHLAEKQLSFSAEQVAADLASKSTDIVSFDGADGEGVSAQIFQRYRTSREWHAAKRDNAISHLGLHKSADVPAKNFPATVDWFIAGHARGRGWLLITRDRGPEFQGLERIGLDMLKSVLHKLAAA